VKLFEKDIIYQILAKKISSDKELVLYGLENGFLPKHIKPVIKELIREEKIVENELIISGKTINLRHIPIKIILK
ncbi:MAG: hypothetical protein LH629_10070, partial [Ignavibacteria bacterium]|nr:hypothetical protein [Ignavibacteria bacterium]